MSAAVGCCRSDLGLALVNFCRIIPDGLLVFFPSYALLTVGGPGWRAAVGAPPAAIARVADGWGDVKMVLVLVGDDRQQVPVKRAELALLPGVAANRGALLCFACAELHQQLEAGARLGGPQHLGAHRKVSWRPLCTLCHRVPRCTALHCAGVCTVLSAC